MAKSLDRDIALAQVETEKKMSLIKAWEESEKTKAENKSQKKSSGICSWENTKKADLEAQLKKMEELVGEKIEEKYSHGIPFIIPFPFKGREKL
ncbi:remorin [Canna indica]|uniref:Remorin n=1 Tax=Canna indica TaxID=4628 RepID=A0AAQ3KHF6_9LILI|nr:remorin [Canna indica]